MLNTNWSVGSKLKDRSVRWDAGFIKFGSRVDLFLPLNTPLDVKVNDMVKGGVQTIAHLP